MGSSKSETTRRRSEFAVLVEELSADLPEYLRPAALRILHTVRSDLQPERSDLAALLAHVLFRERERRSFSTAKRTRPVRPAPPDREIQVRQARPRPQRSPDVPVRSAFHERIQEEGSDEESEASRTLRRRLDITPKRGR